jgi:phosphate:Na+ symporter
MMALVPALAVMLGANVGTTLVVQLLSFDVSQIAPVLLGGGLLAFKRGRRTRTRDLGRTAIGLGLMLLALHFLLDSLAPAESAPAMRTLLSTATAEPVLNVLFGAVLAWAAHSSVVVVILVMSLAYSSFTAPAAALALIVGANLGSAINPLFEAGGSGNPASQRLPVGNLLNRLVGCVLVLPFLPRIAEVIATIDPSPARQAADFHTAFNLVPPRCSCCG